MLTQISISQVRLGPEVPLGRRGCKIEKAKSIEEPSGWNDTYFFEGVNDTQERTKIRSLLKTRGENVFSVLKKVEFALGPIKIADLPREQQEIATQLINFRVLCEDSCNNLTLPRPKGNFGPEFECVVQMALESLLIQTKRDVKVLYPYPEKPYDPDGQKYDVLGGLDLTKLIWIECKKPLYLVGAVNPLQNVLEPSKIKSFYRRCQLLRPTIAVFLVDTQNDYREFLSNVFSNEFLSSGCFVDTASSSSSLLARIHGFIYFAKVDYKSLDDSFNGIVRSISQILHDSRKEWPEIGFNGDPFRN